MGYAQIVYSQILLVDYLGTGNNPAGEDKPEERVKGKKTTKCLKSGECLLLL